MRKISTLFKKDPLDLGRIINVINPENQWVYDEPGIPTRKYDGTACAIINGTLYKRYDVKKGREVPLNAIPCDDPDPITGHWPHWVECSRNNPADKYHFIGYDSLYFKSDGTYELCGEKVQGNPEKIKGHELIKHGCTLININDFSYESLRSFFLSPENDIEGIVFHGKNGKMCKIRKSDFGIKR